MNTSEWQELEGICSLLEAVTRMMVCKFNELMENEKICKYYMSWLVQKCSKFCLLFSSLYVLNSSSSFFSFQFYLHYFFVHFFLPPTLHIMNSMKLVVPLQSLYWSIHTKDESKRGTAFAFIFGVN